MKRIFFALLAAALAGSIMCTPAPGEGIKSGPLKIGAVLPLTGELAKFGEMQKKRVSDGFGSD